MTAFKRKLRAVWNKGGIVGEGPMDPGNHRYVPQALDGGPGWGVFDRLEDRFLTDREIKKLPEEALASEQLPTH